MEIFDDTWDEVEIEPMDVLYDLTNSLHNLKAGGRSTPPSYIAHYISERRDKFEDIIGESISIEQVEAGEIVFYEVETNG